MRLRDGGVVLHGTLPGGIANVLARVTQVHAFGNRESEHPGAVLPQSVAWPVSLAVSNARNEGAQLIEAT